jgi:pyruvate dehydrogenase E1 component beta subunit
VGLVVEEAPSSQSIGATIAAEVTERYFNLLDAPIARVNSADVPNPVSRALEAAAIVSDEKIISMTKAVINRRWR